MTELTVYERVHQLASLCPIVADVINGATPFFRIHRNSTSVRVA